MNKILRRIKLSFVLFPAVLMLLVWILVVAGVGAIETVGLSKLIILAVCMAYVASYCVTMYIHAIREEK